MITNWAGNVRYTADHVTRPTSISQLQQAVTRSRWVRAVGTGHSFNRIADTRGALVALDGLPPMVEIDSAARLLRVSGGMRYGDLVAPLRAAGLALPNTGSLPHITVAGAIATGTHGAGVGNRVLADQVRSMTLVSADGDLVTLSGSSRPDDFGGFPISLGRLGIVTQLDLELVPHFDVAQTVVDDVDGEVVADDLLSVLASAYSVSVFTSWSSSAAPQVWVKDRVAPGHRWAGGPLWGGRPADGPRHPLPGMPPEHATVQMGAPGPWDERLPHFRVDVVPSSGNELQSEYFVAAEQATHAWHELLSMEAALAPVLQISEVRAVAADPLWLSPTRGEPTVAFHFTWVADADAVGPVVAEVEDRLNDFEARPHWGKVFRTSAERLAALHPSLPHFRRLVAEFDPEHKFGNLEVDHWLGLPGGA